MATSYSIPLEPYIARNYKTTVVISPINTSVEKTLDEYIDEYSVDEVVIQTGYADIYFGKDRSPNYFAN